MAMDVNSIREVFTAQRYARTRDTAKLDEYQAPTSGQFLYFYKERDLSSSIQVVVHPELKFEAFLGLPGVTCPKPDQLRHGSNMRQFLDASIAAKAKRPMAGRWKSTRWRRWPASSSSSTRRPAASAKAPICRRA